MAAGQRLLALAASLKSQPNSEDVVAVLSEMNVILESTADKDIVPSLSKLNITDIFACLQSLHQGQVEVTCAVLNQILSLLPVEIFQEMSSFLELGLQHPNFTVITMSLQQVKRCCQSSATVPLILAPTMLHLVTQLLGFDHLDVVKRAHVILVLLCTEERTREFVFSDRTRDGLIGDLKGLIGQSSTVRYRVYELLVEIAVKCEFSFKEIAKMGILTQLVGELDGNDFLVMLNCIEMLIRLQSSPLGGALLESTQAVGKIHSFLVQSRNGNPLLDILVPGILKFFCNIPSTPAMCDRLEQIVSSHPMYLSTVHMGVQQPRCEYWAVSVDSVGVLGSTSAGRKALRMSSELTNHSVSLLGTYVSSLQSEQRIRCLDSISLFLSCNSTPEDEEYTRQLYRTLGDNFASSVFSMIRQPFPKERQSGLRLFAILAGVLWGRKIIKETGGFVEYLINRKSSLGKEEKDLKYDIVRRVVEAEENGEPLFAKAVLSKLKEFCKEGPYYMKAENVVAFQDE